MKAVRARRLRFPSRSGIFSAKRPTLAGSGVHRARGFDVGLEKWEARSVIEFRICVCNPWYKNALGGEMQAWKLDVRLLLRGSLAPRERLRPAATGGSMIRRLRIGGCD